MRHRAEQLRIFSIVLSLSLIAYYVINGGYWWIFWLFNLIVNTVLLIHDSQKRGRFNEPTRKVKAKTT